jgi:hypothetical protein
MAFSVIAAVTDVGRQRIAQMLISGKSFVVNQFSVGDGGHDTLDPETALTPDTSLVTCPSVIFGPESVDSAALVTAYCPQFTCILEESEAISALSNICLIGEIIYPTTDPDYGTTFLFAIGNFPLKVKTGSDVFEFRVKVQL